MCFLSDADHVTKMGLSLEDGAASNGSKFYHLPYSGGLIVTA